MTIPSLPPFFDMKYTTEEGKLTATSKLFNDNVFSSLNQVVNSVNTNINGNWGLAPTKSTAEISDLLASAPLGAFWYNSTISKLQVKTSAGLQTITST